MTSYSTLLSKGLSKKIPETNLLIYFSSNVENKKGQKRGGEFSVAFNKFSLYTISFTQQCFSFYVYIIIYLGNKAFPSQNCRENQFVLNWLLKLHKLWSLSISLHHNSSCFKVTHSENVNVFPDIKK